ncbi:MAG: hypothetical protein AVDCRST_MAG05-4381 [uncultured Rubrobacteraceae bacterium]|uniref:Uncharacterized protein n=1 Tax=uncultured Rubrobacteraceae bacterium TaxID=349277 RepID=A0A6J4TU04_9ACTN|nr:MAG: hypothetical protein AVDCRST_MAG05-4381 [uncultured Rubrobacteraceae bacterium]
MALDGALREVDPGRYLAVGEAAGGEQQDLELPHGERALGSPARLLQHRPRHAQDYVPLLGGEGRRADRAYQLGRGGALEHVPAYPQPQETPHHGRVVEHGHDDDLRPRLDPTNLFEKARGLLERHPRLHDDHVRLRLADEGDGAVVVGRLPDDLQPPVGRKQLGHPLAEHGVIVCQEHGSRTGLHRLVQSTENHSPLQTTGLTRATAPDAPGNRTPRLRPDA